MLGSPWLLWSDDKEKSTHIRFLVSNTAAGCIIGKGGSTITEFQSKSGARIQLSRNHEFFPETSDRIIMISGALNELLKAMELILEKLLSEVWFHVYHSLCPSALLLNFIEVCFLSYGIYRLKKVVILIVYPKWGSLFQIAHVVALLEKEDRP